MAGFPRFSANVLLWTAAIGLAGCRADRPASIPKDAIHAALGRPGHTAVLQFTPDRDGILYVSDAWDNSLVFSGPVHAGDQVTLDRDAGHVTINDHVVFDKPMRHTDHEIFFRPAGP